MKSLKFTFKENKPTGKYRSFFKSEYLIKLNKKIGKLVRTIEDLRTCSYVIKRNSIGRVIVLGKYPCNWVQVKFKKGIINCYLFQLKITH